jgi:hypothetical protein
MAEPAWLSVDYEGLQEELAGSDEILPYSKFITDQDWQTVRDELAHEQKAVKASGQYMFVSRGTVLGRMHQHKQDAYRGYLSGLGLDPQHPDQRELWRNPPDEEVERQLMSSDVLALDYTHEADGEAYTHAFGPDASLEALEDGSLRISHPSRELWKDFREARFLVNPPAAAGRTKERNRMARRLPPRHRSGPKKGQFMSKRSRSRKRKRNPPARATSRRRTSPARRRTAVVSRPRARRRPAAGRSRSYAYKARRRNPPKFTIRRAIRTLQDGAMDAGLILLGKAGTRTIPQYAERAGLNLPRGGPAGLIVAALSALGVGLLADRFLTPARAKMVLAGGLSAPLETLIVSYRVPWLADALAPTQAQAALSSYAVGRYVSPAAGMGRYVQPGLGRYVEPGGIWGRCRARRRLRLTSS